MLVENCIFSGRDAYNVVAFMVKVRLVEKSVNKKVGIVIVVKVIIQYKMRGTTLMRNRAILPNIPNQVLETFSSLCAAAVARATIEAIVESRAVDMELSIAPETGSKSDILLYLLVISI